MTVISQALAAFRAEGFPLPQEQGSFRHPLLDEACIPVDPRTYGFADMGTGGGCTALVMNYGEFSIWVTDEGGSSIPSQDEWTDSLIGVYRDTPDDREELALLTGLQWLEMSYGADFDSKAAPELSAWYIEHVGYDPLKDDPALNIEQLRWDCAELALIHACGGLDSAVYQYIEHTRRLSMPVPKNSSPSNG